MRKSLWFMSIILLLLTPSFGPGPIPDELKIFREGSYCINNKGEVEWSDDPNKSKKCSISRESLNPQDPNYRHYAVVYDSSKPEPQYLGILISGDSYDRYRRPIIFNHEIFAFFVFNPDGSLTNGRLYWEGPHCGDYTGHYRPFVLLRNSFMLKQIDGAYYKGSSPLGHKDKILKSVRLESGECKFQQLFGKYVLAKQIWEDNIPFDLPITFPLNIRME